MTTIPDLPAELLDQLADVGNKALNDHYHDDLCACRTWPDSCGSRGGYFMGRWDTSAFNIALPAIIAAYEQQEAQPAEQVHDELWRHLDWSFWGTGMADTFREPLAAAMLTAITPDQRQQANDLITRWRDHREFVGRDKYEAQKAEIERLRAKLTEAGIDPGEEQQ